MTTTNSLTTIDTVPLTMTTREIAQLTRKRHDNVARDFRHICEQLKIAAEDFEVSYWSPQNKRLPMYSLPKNLTITLISGYSIRMRAVIIQRMFKLEEEQAKASSLGLANSLPQTAGEQSRQVTHARYVEAMTQAIKKAEQDELTNSMALCC